MDIDEPGTKPSIPSLAEHRYFLPGKAASKPQTRFQGRSAKWRERFEHGEVYRAGFWTDNVKRPIELRPYQRAALATHPRCDHAGKYGWTPRSGQRLERTWASDADEGRDLARSRARLPSDNTARGRALRPPSLERQEAFRDARTIKRSMSGTISEETWPDEDDLYRMGLLYDDEQARGSGFGFWAVERPAYSVHYRRRGAKRGRKDGGPGWAAGNLPLEMSLAVLSDDEVIARYLLAPCEEEAMEDDEPGRVAEPAYWTLDSQPTIESSADDNFICERRTTSRSDSSGNTFSLIDEEEEEEYGSQGGSDGGDGDWAFLEQPYATFNEREGASGGDDESTEDSIRRSTRRRESWVVLG